MKKERKKTCMSNCSMIKSLLAVARISEPGLYINCWSVFQLLVCISECWSVYPIDNMRRI